MGEEEGPGYGISDHQAHYTDVAEEEGYQSPGPVRDPLAPRLPPSFSSPSAADPIISTLPVSVGRRIRCSIPFHLSSGIRPLEISLPFLSHFTLVLLASDFDSIEPFESGPLRAFHVHGAVLLFTTFCTCREIGEISKMDLISI